MLKAHGLTEKYLHAWQGVTDLVARLAGVRVGLIMRMIDEDIEVLVSSHTAGNPYRVGERERLRGSGLYCEAVITRQKKLLVPNALQSDAWNNNPDLKHGLVSYLGFPIHSPDGRPFGTICLLDDKENAYSPELLLLMEKMRDLIEGDRRLREENRLQRLFANESLLRRILDNIPTAVACATCDPDPKTLYLNEQFTRTFGYTQSDLPTMDRWFTLFYPDTQYQVVHYQSWQAALQKMQEQPGTAAQNELAVTCKDGRVRDVLVRTVTVDDLLAVSFVDITELRCREQELAQAHDALVVANTELQRLATTDALTGIWNRRRFEEDSAIQVAQARRHDYPLSLLLLDIDHFKSINDRYGHQRGDGVLVKLSQCLQGNRRITDRLARWGGEEFVVLLPYCDATLAVHTAEKLRVLVERQSLIDVGAITISIGVAECKPDETMSEWFKRVDEALYLAKAAGRNTVRLSPEELKFPAFS